jgi:pimeloyl-ACP methyl ester carboxylesterase
LKNLAANGRVSPAVAKIAGVLGIRVVGKASLQGTLEPLSKCRGEAKALLAIVNHLKEEGFAEGKVRIAHCQNEAAAQELAQRYYVILPDSRGHGASQPVTRYSYREMAKDMAALLDALNMNGVTVFGFSDGGIIALLMAMHHPQRLRRIIAAGANAHPLGVAFSCLRDVVKEWVKTRDGKLFLMMTQPMMTRRQLGKIKLPVRIVAGEFDLIRPAHTRSIAAAIPGAQVHFVPGEDHGSYIVGSTKFITEAQL